MAFVKLIRAATEYKGESFTRTISRKSGSIWETTDSLTYEMLDGTGNVVSSGSLTKSNEDKDATFTVPSGDTATLEGEYLILVYLKNTDNADFNDVIAEYNMTYRVRKAK